MTDTDERLSALETRLAELENVLDRLKKYARLTPTGRVLLKIVGAS
jgi:uncharacterized coiled-coil protein SlyX